MNIEIITTALNLNMHGFSGQVVNKDYTGTAFALMNNMWRVIKSAGLKNKGINIWVYEPAEKIFVGVELDDTPVSDTELEHKYICLTKYAYYKHTGPYQGIKQAALTMRNELKSKGIETCYPAIEIYGHWMADESKLETGLIMCLQ